MRSKEALKLLNVSRVSLSKYVKNGTIKVTKMKNGYYEYDDASIYKFLGKQPKINVIYSRVSTSKQKKDLENQTNSLKKYCQKKKVTIGKTFSEIGSGIDLNRTQLSKMLELVLKGGINNIFITYKDRLSRTSFPFIKSLFDKFGTKIVIINEDKKTLSSEEEIFQDLISLMNSFSTEMYSKRRTKKLDLVKQDLALELTKLK